MSGLTTTAMEHREYIREAIWKIAQDCASGGDEYFFGAMTGAILVAELAGATYPDEIWRTR